MLVELLCPHWSKNEQSFGRVAQPHEKISRKAHPNLYKILELFQREQAATEVAIQQLEAGGVRKPKRKKVIRREDKTKSLADELTNGERDIDSYLTAIRHCVVSFDFS